MDDFRLKVFITAARTLSFTRTAEQLYISQPAVSKHIGELESRYKVQLFARRGSRLELTDAGRTMLGAAERLAEDYRSLEYEMSLCASLTEGELRLGASTTIAQYLLPPILARFTARFPGVRVSVLSGNSAEVEQALGARAVFVAHLGLSLPEHAVHGLAVLLTEIGGEDILQGSTLDAVGEPFHAGRKAGVDALPDTGVFPLAVDQHTVEVKQKGDFHAAKLRNFREIKHDGRHYRHNQEVFFHRATASESSQNKAHTY